MRTLKIDRSLVQYLHESQVQRTIVQAVIELAHHLGMDVVAEGVETAEQSAVLQRMQCDTIQGYVFAHPMPFEYFVGFVQERAGAC